LELLSINALKVNALKVNALKVNALNVNALKVNASKDIFLSLGYTTQSGNRFYIDGKSTTAKSKC